MKINKITAYLGAMAAFAFASCSEGQYWDGPSQEPQVYAFEKPAETVSIPADAQIPSSYDVTVSRGNNSGEVTIPVDFKSSSPLMTGPAEVKFAAGSNTATYTINIADGIKAGIDYRVQLSLAQPEDGEEKVSEDNLTYTLNFSQVLVLKWEQVGVASAVETLFDVNSPVDIPLLKAVNWPVDGQQLMRLESPYYYFVGEGQGYNIDFYLNDKDEAVSMRQDWQYTGVLLSGADGGYCFFGTPAAYGGQFISEGDMYQMAGVMGLASSPTGTPSPAYNETITFQWLR